MAVKKRTPGEIQNYAVSLATNPNLSGPGKEIAKMLLETQAALKETKRQAGLVEIDRRKLQSRAGKQKHQLGITNAAYRVRADKLLTAQRNISDLARALVTASVFAGITDGNMPLDGPQVLLLAEDLRKWIKDKNQPQIVSIRLGSGQVGVGVLTCKGGIPSLNFTPMMRSMPIGSSFGLPDRYVPEEYWKRGGVHIEFGNSESLEVLQNLSFWIQGFLDAKEEWELANVSKAS
jgi:hypothetical protein